MSRPDRLSGLDVSFLHLEERGAHMHIGSCLLFKGAAPDYDNFVARLERRLHLVPRYRQKLAFVPMDQGRPVWVDDPFFKLGYHVLHAALPGEAGIGELKELTARILSQRLDRGKPLWELWLVEGVAGDHWALVSKAHHCLVDGVAGIDLTTVLFDSPEDGDGGEADAQAPEPWVPRPEPSAAALLADAALDRARAPMALVRGAAGAVARPSQAANRAGTVLAGLGSMALTGRTAPPSPYNTVVGPHRRFEWVEEDLGRFRAIGEALGGTVNDAVLTAVSGALREHLISRGRDVSALTLRAMVPVSVRPDSERSTPGNRVAAVYAPLPVHAEDPGRRFAIVHEAMAELKDSGQAAGADALTRLSDFASPTMLAQAARLQAHQRVFNVTVTNVPGPPAGLELLGRRLERIFPQVPLANNASLGVAAMSYDGTLNFGLLGDYDAMPDLDALAGFLHDAIEALDRAAKPGRAKGGGRFSRPARDRSRSPLA
jgi:diacylglycerol O-acyltransferase